MFRLLAKFLLLALVATAHGQDPDYSSYEYDNNEVHGQDPDYNNYQYDDDDGEGEYDEDYTPTDVLPTFLATPQVFTVEVGGKITFPCEVQNQGNHVLMFKHILPNGENRLLYLGDTDVRHSRKLVRQGSSFVLSGVKKRHAGQYACRFETSPITQLTHTLNIQYAATVQRVSPAVQHVVQGSSVMLECRADGSPTAAISWSRMQGHLPSGAQSEEGLSITLENVDRHVEGTYICTASNGIGHPSSATMTIEVEYPPEIIKEQAILHTGEGDEAKLVCIVHGRPAPLVSWTKNGTPLDPSRHVAEHNSVHRHTLTIKEVFENDFGEYSCHATNKLGNNSSILRLTGLPKPPLMTSSPAGGEENSYTLTWKTESYTPVVMYRLQYRKFQMNITGQPQVQWNVRLYSTKEANHNPSGPMHYMTHGIQDLEAAMDYEARVAVENKFGWSEFSRVFHFYTRKEEPTTTTTTSTTTVAPETTKMALVKKEVAIGQSSAVSGCEGAALSMALLTLALAPLFS